MMTELETAVSLMQKGDATAALQILQQRWCQDLKNPYILALMAEACFHLEQYAKAEQYARMAFDIDKNSDIACRVLGDIALLNRDYHEAVNHFFNALVLRPYDRSLMDKMIMAHAGTGMAAKMRFFDVCGLHAYCQAKDIILRRVFVEADHCSHHYVAELGQVQAIGQSSLLLSDDNCFLLDDDDLAESGRGDIVSTTLMKNILGFEKSVDSSLPDRVLAILPIDYEQIEECIILNHRGADNYYHWLLEGLPKWMLIEILNDYQNLPILVHGHMPTQHYEALRQLVGYTRKIILAEGKKSYRISNAIIPFPVSQILFNPLPGILVQDSDVNYCRQAIDYLRTRFLNTVKDIKRSERKIYLSRRSSKLGKRKMLNQKEVEALFIQHGFEVIDTAQMTFDEQVNLFASASVIAGPSGASFANLIFCQPNCTVILFAQKENNQGVYYRNLAKVCGMTHFIEIPVQANVPEQDDFHQDYFVSTDELEKLIKHV